MDFYSLMGSINLLELIAFCLSLSYVILATQQSRYCWYPAVFSSAIHTYLVFQQALYFETTLTTFYFFMAIYGIVKWRKISQEKSLPITQKPLVYHLILIILGCCLSFGLGFLAQKFTGQKMAYIDAFTTVFSFITTYMVVKKWLENWLYWIVIDAVSVYLYWNRDLRLLASLFLLYTILAIYGFFTWRKSMLKVSQKAMQV